MRTPDHDVTIEEAHREGIAWAESCAATAPIGGPAGEWPRERSSARIILATRGRISDEAVTACIDAAAARWAVLVAAAAEKRLRYASEQAQRILDRIAAAIERGTTQHVVGVTTVQMPIVDDYVEAVAGPLLVTLVRWSDGHYEARLPACEMHTESSRGDGDAVWMLHDAVVDRAVRAAGNGAGRDTHALMTLVRRRETKG